VNDEKAAKKRQRSGEEATQSKAHENQCRA
jgi:hypothetical protein